MAANDVVEWIQYRCPNCNYIVAEEMFKSAKYNYECGRCGEAKLSEFKIEKIKALDVYK